jgi:hypothetical protein
MRKTLLFLILFPVLLLAQTPADRTDAIVKGAIANKPKNDPQRVLESFAFRGYTKLIVTANPDSIPGKIDTVMRRKFLGRRYPKIDSTQYKFKKFVRRQHFFETEKVSDFQFDGTRLKETVTGTKMAGFREPIYEVLGFKLQSFSIYADAYELFETKYNNPIANGARRDYTYKLLDSVTISGRKAYRIAFKNKKKRREAGLEGVLWIDAANFAIARAEMHINGVLKIRSVHEFRFLADEKIWFPTARSFKISKGNSDEDIRLPGTTIEFDAADDELTRPKMTSDFTYLLAKTYYSDLRYNEPVKIKKTVVAVEVRPDAIDKPESFWRQYRKDSLDIREKRTYEALDSIVGKERIDKKLRLGRKIINGYVPFGPIDLDLRYLLSYNNYEGFRLGLGGVTNDLFSRKYRVEGYTAYGTKDGQFKYNIGAAARIGQFSGTWIGGSYTDDVREIASTSFAIDKRVFKLYDPRPINVSTFYNYRMLRAQIETRIIPKTESVWQLSRSIIEPKFDYAFNLNGNLYTLFHMTTALASVQWNPFSDYMQTPDGRIEIEKRYPKFTFQLTQALPDILDNDFIFGKFDFRCDYEKKYLNGQKTSALVEAGYAWGDTPLTHLYNTSPNNLTKDAILQRVTIAGKNSFETMYFNEFFSSRYVMLQFKHGFRRTKILGPIKPAVVLVTRMAWGGMQHPERHVGLEYKTLDDGYFESGIELNRIYKIFGLSGFYRYGANHLPRFEDNIAIKVSALLNLGF